MPPAESRCNSDFMLALVSVQHVPTSAPANRTSQAKKWTLTWSDEFNAATGSPPDPAKWVVESGGHGWGNHELEYYTSRPENLRQENGNLVIEAINKSFTGSEGVTRNYTSARL